MDEPPTEDDTPQDVADDPEIAKSIEPRSKQNTTERKTNGWFGIFSCMEGETEEENESNMYNVYLRNFCIHWKSIIAVLTPLILLPILLWKNALTARCGYIMALMTVYWITRAIPLPLTAVLPMAMFPLFGIEHSEKVCTVYFSQAVAILMGALILGQATAVCHLHERISMKIILLIGSDIKQLMLGIMLSSMFLSMWMSNIATTTVMIPLVGAVVRELQKVDGDSAEVGNDPLKEVNAEDDTAENDQAKVGKEEADAENEPAKLETDDLTGFEDMNLHLRRSPECTGLHLAVGYAASIGGTGSLVGSGINVAFLGILENLYPAPEGLTFTTWMAFSIPNMLVCIFLVWFFLQLYFMKLFRGGINRQREKSEIAKHVLRQKYERLGPMTYQEITVLILFIVCVLMWIFRSPYFFNGWADSLPKGQVKDATTVMALVIIIHVLPATKDYLRCNLDDGTHKVSPNLISWKLIQEKMPWGLLLLIGSGFALVHGIKVSGLFTTFEEQLSFLESVHPLLALCFICFFVTGLTQLASTVVTANVCLPVIAAMAAAMHTHPLYFMLPAVFCSSYTFILHRATASNAIILLSGNIKKMDMVKPGIIACLICMVVTVISAVTYGSAIFGLDTFPSWAAFE